jgi:hypothetical protein
VRGRLDADIPPFGTAARQPPAGRRVAVSVRPGSLLLGRATGLGDVGQPHKLVAQAARAGQPGEMRPLATRPELLWCRPGRLGR